MAWAGVAGDGGGLPAGADGAGWARRPEASNAAARGNEERRENMTSLVQGRKHARPRQRRANAQPRDALRSVATT